ncbi:uncharacterized protein [Parasteatoda tepidariorum]|uniref:uncharacterized protein n=1 Tax=Parasteatoda tepidariorum TaxID=114398 RepID=UPI0039BD3A3F
MSPHADPLLVEKRNDSISKTSTSKDPLDISQQEMDFPQTFRHISRVYFQERHSRNVAEKSEEVWKNHLQWPNIDDKKKDQIRRKTNKLLFALTSEKWQKFQEAERSKKKLKQENMEKKKKEKILKKEKKLQEIRGKRVNKKVIK